MILSTAYFAPIIQYALIAQSKEYEVEAHEHFVKQSYRSRNEIYGANGKLSLVIPLKKWRNHTLSKDIEISYAESWINLHWRSIESAYRTSPYFEFYEEELKSFFFSEEKSLFKRNQFIENNVKEIVGIHSANKETGSYLHQEYDWRKVIHPKNKEICSEFHFPKYIQVFEEKHAFIENLSILDLLFNLGPNCKEYLEKLRINK